MFKRYYQVLIILLATVFLTSACTFPWSKQTEPESGSDSLMSGENASSSTLKMTNTRRLKKFSDYEQLAEFLAANNNPEGTLTRSSERAADDVDLNYLADSSSVSGTGEGNLIQTDGSYIYVLAKNELSIVKASPASEAKIVSSVSFKSRPQSMIMSGNFLAVYGPDTDIVNQDIYQDFRRHNTYTFFKVFDLSDPANPKQVRDLDFEGEYKEIRLIGDYAYFITETPGSYVAGEPLLPRTLENGLALATQCDGNQRCFAPELYYFDIPYDDYAFITIAAINIKNNSETLSGQTYVVDSEQEIYASNQNIYLSYTDHLDKYSLEQQVRRRMLYDKLPASDQERINKLEAVDAFVLNNHEKTAKIGQILDRYLENLSVGDRALRQAEIDSELKKDIAAAEKIGVKTAIHKISLNGNKFVYSAFGEINGRNLQRASWDEKGNYLRIATARASVSTKLNAENADYYSNIYVLDNNLKTVGRLENLTTSAEIIMARFWGDRAYLLTAKVGDPLFVITLNDPTKPDILGALKVPGVSNYLYPIDDSAAKLLSLGRTTEDGATGSAQATGLKLSLFDFSDLTKPKELDNYLISNNPNASIALKDYQSFHYSTELKTLVIPAALQENNRLVFSGALVFSVSNDRLELKGKIDHSAGGYFTQVDSWHGLDYYNNTVKRSLALDAELLTFSNKFLKINALDDLSDIKSLELTSDGNEYIIAPAATISDSALTVGATGGEAAASNDEPVVSESDPVDAGATIPGDTSPQP